MSRHALHLSMRIAFRTDHSPPLSSDTPSSALSPPESMAKERSHGLPILRAVLRLCAHVELAGIAPAVLGGQLAQLSAHLDAGRGAVE